MNHDDQVAIDWLSLRAHLIRTFRYLVSDTLQEVIQRRPVSSQTLAKEKLYRLFIKNLRIRGATLYLSKWTGEYDGRITIEIPGAVITAQGFGLTPQSTFVNMGEDLNDWFLESYFYTDTLVDLFPWLAIED